ncbi:AAA family ATPase, partial [Prevotella sp.]
MNNIKDITIRNYRGIRYAEVSGMARVNVFLGNNNCGKSSV